MVSRDSPWGNVSVRDFKGWGDVVDGCSNERPEHSMNNPHWGIIHDIVEFQDSKVLYKIGKTTKIKCHSSPNE